MFSLLRQSDLKCLKTTEDRISQRIIKPTTPQAYSPFPILQSLPNRIWLITLTVVVSSLKDGEATERD
jgi:hypothetical protein